MVVLLRHCDATLRRCIVPPDADNGVATRAQQGRQLRGSFTGRDVRRGLVSGCQLNAWPPINVPMDSSMLCAHHIIILLFDAVMRCICFEDCWLVSPKY